MSKKASAASSARVLTRLRLKNFTTFSDLDLEPSRGVNVFVGTNGTGKTHLMKVAYAACAVAKTGEDMSEKLIRVFLPRGRALGRLVRRQQGQDRCAVEVRRANRLLRTQFATNSRTADAAFTIGAGTWKDSKIDAVYIPVKEMLAHAPGFLSLYASREIPFDETYADLLHRAFRPIPRGPLDPFRKRFLPRLREAIGGSVTVENEEFYLRNRRGNLEFSLLAEGVRKLALLWLLIHNGSLTTGSVLFWDEPETNLNPSLFGIAMETILELQRIGVQVFLATHDYVILKELDLRRKPSDEATFHSLFHGEDGRDVECRSSREYSGIDPNAIAETFDSLYDRTISKDFPDIAK